MSDGDSTGAVMVSLAALQDALRVASEFVSINQGTQDHEGYLETRNEVNDSRILIVADFILDVLANSSLNFEERQSSITVSSARISLEEGNIDSDEYQECRSEYSPDIIDIADSIINLMSNCCEIAIV